MSTDAMTAQINDYSGDVYDQLLKDAEVDNRVGKHKAIVVKVVHDTWDSGDPRHKFSFSLLTAGNAKADMTWSDPPSIEDIVAQKNNWEPAKKKGIASAVSLARQLAQHYSKRVVDIAEGDEFEVQTVKTRRDKDGSGGFIRVISFLPPGAVAGVQEGTSGKGPNF